MIDHAARKFGTPLFLYDQELQRTRYRQLRAVLPKSVDINYALKANGALALAANLRKAGAGADICSHAELVVAQAAGFAADRILYTGAAKTEEELDAAVATNVHRVAVESLGEAQRLDAIARRAGKRQPVLLRVHQKQGAGAGGAMRFVSDKFGFTEDGLITDLPQLMRLDGLHVQGLLYHTESCVTDCGALLAVQQGYLDSARRIADAGLAVSHVDLGGGIGVPYRVDEPPLDIAAYGSGLNAALTQCPNNWTYALDLGRYLVAESGTLVLTIADVRHRYGRRWILTDGGMQVLNRPRFRIANALARSSGTGPDLDIPTSVAGPLLTPDDVLIDDIALPHVQPGDLLWIARVGAYGYSHGLQGFCLSRAAAEAAMDGDAMGLIRERPAPADALQGQYLGPEHNAVAAPETNAEKASNHTTGAA